MCVYVFARPMRLDAPVVEFFYRLGSVHCIAMGIRNGLLLLH